MPSPACSSMMQPPWLVAGLNNNVWVLWTWVSNHLASPRVLACPSDLKKTATNWGSSVNGGLWNAAYQNQAVSYLAGMDVFPEAGLGLLAGDRNVTFNATSASCSAGVAPIRTINASASGFGIGTGLHERAGNFLLTDGRVEELSSAAFVRRFREIHGWVDDVGYFHYLAP